MMICNKCGYEYSKDFVDSYKNVYGTRCPKCNNLIKPEQEPEFIKKNKNKKNIIAAKCISLIKRKILKRNEE